MKKKLRKILPLFKKILTAIYIKIFDKSPLLLLIFLLALFLRELGTHPGYNLFHPDESSIWGSVQKIILTGAFKPNDFYYGALLIYLYTFFALFTVVPYVYGLSAIKFFIFNDNTPFYVLIRGFNLFDPSINYVDYWSRYDTAFVCAFTPVVIYFIGKKLFNKEVGFLAAFFTAVNYRHVLSSIFVLADAPAALFAGLSVLFSIIIIPFRVFPRSLLRGIFIIGGSRHSNISILEAIQKIEIIFNKKAKVSYSKENRNGDHIWYISSVAKFKKHYPKWNYEYNIDKILEEMCSVGHFK